MMEYKGYRAAVTFDDEADVFHGEVVSTRDVVVFEGTSVAQLKKEFTFSIDDYLKVCKECERTPDRPQHPPFTPMSLLQNSQQGWSSCRQTRDSAFFSIGCDLAKKAF